MSLKIEFVERATKGEKIATLCRAYGISRTTGHKWIKRFRERGYDGLEEESRRPKSAPLATAEDLVMAVLEARSAHPRWGPKKLQDLLRRQFKDKTPSERTIARILKRAHLVRKRRRQRPLNVVERAPQVVAKAPNDVWTVDFKGWWRARSGERCEPLTIRDAYSRFVLGIELCSTSYCEVRAIFESLFRRHGAPKAIQCDNGVPFVSVRSRGGLSRLSAWWVSLGIRIVRSRPGCPQDNGGHERMHRDMRADVQAYPAATRAAEQRQLARWRQEFNHVRPHQALGGKTPAEVYKPTNKRKAETVTPVYPRHFDIVPVYRNGATDIDKGKYFVSSSLAGHEVAVERIDSCRLRLWFHDVDLGLLDVEPAIDDGRFAHLVLNQKRSRKPPGLE